MTADYIVEPLQQMLHGRHALFEVGKIVLADDDVGRGFAWFVLALESERLAGRACWPPPVTPGTCAKTVSVLEARDLDIDLTSLGLT